MNPTRSLLIGAGMALCLARAGAALDTGPVNTAAADAAAVDAAAVDTVVDEWLSQTGAPSASIAIVRQGRLAYVKAYGSARLQPAVVASPATRYAIDSVSKEFTAATLLQLAEQGKLSLDDAASRYIPRLRTAGSVTLRQLLTHTSGIRDFWPQDFVTPEMTRPTTADAIIDEWVQKPLDFEPGTDWQYSNTGYVLAGAIAEIVARESLFEFQTRHIFTPLHMTRVTQYSPAIGQRSTLTADDASGYTRHGTGRVVPAPKEGAGWLFASAHLAMQPADLALWDMSLINRSLLSAESYKAEFDPIVLKDGKKQSYALGLDVESTQDRVRIGHGGGGSGFLSDNRIWPQERLAIIVFTNNDWAPPSELGARIAFLMLTPTPAEDRARRLFRSLQDGTVDRSLFTDIGNYEMTASALADLKSSLGALGPPRLILLEKESQRGGMVTRRWKILCRAARLSAVERGYSGGKLDQFRVTERTD